MYFTSDDIRARRQRLAEKWNAILTGNEAVAVYSGAPVQKPGGLAQTYPFMPHPAYFWLTGRRRENEVVLYSPAEGWIEFQKSIPAEEAVWEGERQDLLVNDPGKSLGELEPTLRRFASVYRLGASGSTEGKAFNLRTALDQTRRVKDEAEIRLIRELADIAAHGYRKIAVALRPGITELEIQLAFENEVLHQGAQGVPYETIVGSGSNSAILHALPTRKMIAPNEFVLVDAGCAIHDYCVDITRMFASSEPLSERHHQLYRIVHRALEECIAMSAPGIQWRDVHLHAGRVITEGLLELGLLKGNLDSLLEKEVGSLFFPHGVGHLVGLRVRDTGQEENINPKTYMGARLRVDLKLEEGHLITVEPGCYFIPSLLNDPERRKKYHEDVNWKELEHWLPIGGVRIEDNILITREGNDNLTIGVPKLL